MHRRIVRISSVLIAFFAFVASISARENLPDRVHGWDLRSMEDSPFLVYGHKKRDLAEVLERPMTAFTEAAGGVPAPGLIIVTEGSRDAVLLVEVLKGYEEADLVLGDMNFGDELSLEQALAMVPIPLPREVVAKLLDVDTAALADLEWFMAIPSASAQKRALKTLMKEQMKKEGVNLALRLLIRPFLGKIVGIAVEALEPAAHVMLMQQWLEASGLPEEEAASILEAFEATVTEDMEKRLEEKTKDLEASAEALSSMSNTNATQP